MLRAPRYTHHWHCGVRFARGDVAGGSTCRTQGLQSFVLYLPFVALQPQEKPFYGIFKSRTAAKATATNLFRVLAPFMKEHYPVFYEGLRHARPLTVPWTVPGHAPHHVLVHPHPLTHMKGMRMADGWRSHNLPPHPLAPNSTGGQPTPPSMRGGFPPPKGTTYVHPELPSGILTQP